jgi:glucan phosphoethanolaminetransferase (alkaline phosphatase superfamily)
MLSRFRSILFSFAVLTLVDIFFIRGSRVFFEHFLGVRFIVNYLVTSLGLYLLLFLIQSLLYKKKASRVVGFFLILIPLLIQDSHYAIYKTFLSSFGILFFFENPSLTAEMGGDTLKYGRIFVLLIMSFVAIFALFRFRRKPSRVSVIAAVLAFLVVVPLSALHWYGATIHQNSIIAAYGSLAELVKGLHFNRLKKNGSQVTLKETTQKLPNIVWIVGESLTLSHMSLYGYNRDTTPNLTRLREEEKLVAFQNAIAIGPFTRISVPYMLVGLQGVDPYGLIYSQPTIFDYAKARGYHTAFISAQELKWGDLDQILVNEKVDIFKSGSHFSSNITVSKGANDHQVLRDGIVPHLQNVKEPYLLVVQMDGNHYPYSTHSEPAFKKFLPEKFENDINAYDNSVAYSDAFFQMLHDEVRKKDKDAWIFYSSDHGQNLGTNESFFHSGYARDVIHNALFVLPPSGDFANLKAQERAPVSQADVFATVLDLMDAEPVKEIDGLSLRREIDPQRLRVSSTYMITLHNEPNAVLIFPDMTYYHIDFARNNVTLKDGNTVVPYDQLEPAYRERFEKRMKCCQDE